MRAPDATVEPLDAPEAADVKAEGEVAVDPHRHVEDSTRQGTVGHDRRKPRMMGRTEAHVRSRGASSTSQACPSYRLAAVSASTRMSECQAGAVAPRTHERCPVFIQTLQPAEPASARSAAPAGSRNHD